MKAAKVRFTVDTDQRHSQRDRYRVFKTWDYTLEANPLLNLLSIEVQDGDEVEVSVKVLTQVVTKRVKV
jgi:hypothetical protein